MQENIPSADTAQPNVDVIVIAGISGCGKTTLAKALAQTFSIQFVEADDFHTVDAKQKMADGIPLNDTDRAPWLAALNKRIHRVRPVVLACSALKAQYRHNLTKGLSSKTIWLKISHALAEQRVSKREGHFMPSSLVTSQLQTAEQPCDALVLEAGTPIDELLEKSLRYIL